jgi:F-type H+-transporting ATPase subunit gamma
MIALAKLKQDLRFTQDLGDIIDVLKSAALIQLRLFQLKEKPNQEFLKELEAAFNLFAPQNIQHPYLTERTNLPSAIVVVTSDEGFLGELNTLLINVCLDQRKAKSDIILALGERGVRYLEEAGEDFISFPGVSNEVSYAEVEKLRSYLLKGYSRGRFGRILVIYPEFVSLTVQKIVTFQLLPFSWSKEQAQAKQEILEDMLLEPSLNRVLGILAKLWVGFKLLEIFWSTKQSEFAARIVHLEGSTEELSHLNHRLAFEYFRNVHALNDKTIREISASKVLLSKKRI